MTKDEAITVLRDAQRVVKFPGQQRRTKAEIREAIDATGAAKPVKKAKKVKAAV